MSDETYLIASLAGRTVAFPSAAIDAVVDLDVIVPTPRAAPGVVGIAALRSRVVTVVDPRHALGAPARGDGRRAIVATFDGHVYAVLVDALSDVARHVATPVPAGIVPDGGWGCATMAMIECDGAPTLVLDLARLIPAGVA